MPSPFPGMDPYLEGYLWPDVHNGLAFVIKEQLVPLVSPGYVVRTDTYIVRDTSPEEDVGIMYPDVDILNRKQKLQEPEETYQSLSTSPPTPPTISIPFLQPIEVRIPVVEIRDRKDNRLITAIEILSPVNKRKPGFEPYREKRLRLYRAGVHLLEIDLIRRGERPFYNLDVPQAHYWVTLVRAGSEKADIWAFNVQDALPAVPVPLLPADEDRVLDLGQSLQILYERSRYELSIDYQEKPPPPPFGEDARKWMKQLLEEENRK
ncbi:MAG: DUF4058 family protein [Phaeodactylibacter sp.]|nr:DUF4058 family protein [Phaeodactylibacter sp.]MCB9285775.1 DUF4058 family protein [Lewinellaceae bacterium]